MGGRNPPAYTVLLSAALDAVVESPPAKGDTEETRHHLVRQGGEAIVELLDAANGFIDAAESAATTRMLYPNDADGCARAVDRLDHARSAVERARTLLPPELEEAGQALRVACARGTHRIVAGRYLTSAGNMRIRSTSRVVDAAGNRDSASALLG